MLRGASHHGLLTQSTEGILWLIGAGKRGFKPDAVTAMKAYDREKEQGSPVIGAQRTVCVVIASKISPGDLSLSPIGCYTCRYPI